MTSYRRPRRRASGEGSVYLSRTEGRWRGALTWTDEAGKLHRRLVSGKSQADVRRRLGELRTGLDHGLEPARAGSVGEYLAGWLDRDRQRIRPSTWRQREQYVRLYIVPVLGRKRLAKLTPADVERMTAWIIETGRSPRTASHARVILRRALADALRDGTVHRNVAALARPPKVPTRTIEPGRDYLDAADLRRLLAVATEYDVGNLVAVAAATGLRQGELLGLTWDDVGWEARTVTVRRSLALSWAGGRELATTKTPRSRRTVPLTTTTVEALRREQRAQAEAREAAGSAWQDRVRLVFTDAAGRPLYRTAVHRAFHDLLTAAGVPSVPFHGLRHSAATTWLGAGVPLRVVSDLLGHSGIAITADTYAHVTPELRETAREAMERALGDDR